MLGLSVATVLLLAACGPAPSKAPAKTDAASPAVSALPAGPITGPLGSEAPPALAVPTTPAETSVIDQAAIEARYAPEYAQCLQSGDAAQGQTLAMSTCIAEEVGHQNRLLNEEYQRVIAELPATQAVILRKAERRWINERDAKCRAAASSGGTIDRLNGPACVLSETVRRIIELERMAPKPAELPPEGEGAPEPQQP